MINFLRIYSFILCSDGSLTSPALFFIIKFCVSICVGMINKDERRDVSIRKPRPSIRKQLADSKQATSPKKAAARTKKNELEV